MVGTNMDDAYWDETQEIVKRLANGKNRDDDTRWHRGILSTSENKEYLVWIYERGTNQRNGFLILKKREPSPQSKKPQSKLYHSVETDNCQVWSFSNATEKYFGYGEMERFFGNDCQLKYIEDSIPGRTVETIRTDSAPHALEKSEGKRNEIQRNSAWKKNNKQKNISRQVYGKNISHSLKSIVELENWQKGSAEKERIITDLKKLVRNVFSHFQKRRNLDVVKSIEPISKLFGSFLFLFVFFALKPFFNTSDVIFHKKYLKI